MKLTDLKTFCLVAEAGTISAAAGRLGVPKSTVSRRVRRLEDDLGKELLRRSPRSVSLTEHGRALHQRSAPALRELEEAAAALADTESEPSGRLRVTTVPSFGHSHVFLGCLRDYGLRYPKTSVEVELTTRLVDIVEEGFDIGLRLHRGTLPGNPSLMSRRLLRHNRGLYASPGYVKEKGCPMSLDDLENHRLAAHSIVDVTPFEWLHEGVLMGERRPLPGPRWLMNDVGALERFVLTGGGLALLSVLDGDRLVASGSLVRVLPDHQQLGAIASLIWPSSRHLAPRVRAFIDHAVATMGVSSD